MSNYPTENSDVFILGDTTRQQLAYNVNGVNFTSPTNAWYIANQNIQKGYLASINDPDGSSPGSIGIADKDSITTIVGMALNSANIILNTTANLSTVSYNVDVPTANLCIGMSVTGTGIAGSTTITGITSSTRITINNYPNANTAYPNPLTFFIAKQSVTSSIAINSFNVTATTTNLAVGMLVIGIGIQPNTVISSITSGSIFVMNKSALATNGTAALIFGLGVEVSSSEQFNFATSVFDTTEVGLALYISPDVHTNYTSSGTLGTHPQLTTNRSLAATSGMPLIEIGVVSSQASMLVQISGDVRGATGLSQITANAGESIDNIGLPIVVSMGSDGNIYTADRRKSYNNIQPRFFITNNTCNVGLAQTSVSSTVINFYVTSGCTGGSGNIAFTGSYATGNIAVVNPDTASQVAAKIAAVSVTGWKIVAVDNYITLTTSSIVALPVFNPNSTGVTISTMNILYSPSSQTKVTVTGISSGSGSINIAGITVQGSALITSTPTCASAIITAFNGSTTWGTSLSSSTITFTPKISINRNSPIGFLVGANSGYTNSYSSNSGSSTSTTIKKTIWVAELGLFVAVGTGTVSYYSYNGITWTATANMVDGTSRTWSDVAWSSSLGYMVAITNGTQQAAYSSNGTSWTSVLLSSSSSWSAIQWCSGFNSGAGYFVAVASGTTNTCYSATYNATFTAGGALTTNPNWDSLSYSPSLNRLVTISSSSAVANYSGNGTSWTAGSTGLSSSGFVSLKWSSVLNIFVALCKISNSIISVSSSDGINWTEAASLPSVSGTTVWSALDWNPDRNIYVAVANNTTVATVALSYDGRTWTQISPTSFLAKTWLTMAYSSTLQLFTVLSGTANDAETIYFGGNILSQTPVVVQKAGIIQPVSPAWSGLQSGSAIYNDINGNFITNVNALSYYNDIATPLGYISSSNSIYTSIGYNTQKTDSNPIGSIIARPATLDYGWLTCDGSAIPRTTPYADLFNIIGTTYGSGNGTTTFNIPTSGSIAYFTITHNASGSTGPLTWGGGAAGTVAITTGDSIATVASKIAASPPVGWNVVSDGVSLVTMTFSGNVAAPTLNMGSTAVTLNAITFTPSISPFMQIKYLNWYLSNPTQAPTYRYDTGYSNWTAALVTTGYVSVPITTFGNNPNPEDLFVELYIKNTSSGIVWKIDTNPVIIGANYYGFQLYYDPASPTTVKINFAQSGLAYIASTGSAYTAVPTTGYQYRVLVYKTEKYNKYYDYTADQKMNQMWSLGLLDYTSPFSVQGTGYFDRSTTDPNTAHTTRLNYDGNLYTSNQFITNNLTVGTNTTGILTIYNYLRSTNTTATLFDSNATTINIGSSSAVTNLLGTTVSTLTSNGALVIAGGVGIGGSNTLGGVTTITNNTASTTTTSGALIVTGGIGTANNINVAGTTNIGGVTSLTSNTASTAYNNGTLVVTGGVGISGAVFTNSTMAIAGITTLTKNTASSAYNNGTLVVTGGVGISDNIYVHGNAVVDGTITITNAGALAYSATVPSLSATSILGYNGYFYGTKVFSAVWNDIADFIDVENSLNVEFGYVYAYNGSVHFKTNKYAQIGIIGITTDTFGMSVGKKDDMCQLPIAIGGFVLAHVDNIYASGTTLTCNDKGELTKANILTRIFNPERIIATFYKIEKEENWNGIKVNNRNWVKIQ